MLYQNIELTNVNALLTGDITTVLDEETRAWLREYSVGVDESRPQRPPEGGYWLSRLPETLRRQVNPAARAAALHPSACELRFNLQSETARVTLQGGPMPTIVEVYQGPFMTSWHVLGPLPTAIPIALPPNLSTLEALARENHLPWDPRLTRVRLPYFGSVWLLGLEGAFTPPRPEQTPPQSLLCYGSSITHGALALRPTGTYAARLAESLGMDLINLGFGGGAHLDPPLADAIAARDDWHMATLEMGVNMTNTFSVDEFAARVDTFLPTIARAHPDRWLFCTDLFRCHHEPQHAAKIRAFRQVVRRAVERLASPRVVYLSGLRLLPSAGYLTADLVHPTATGQETIAANLGRAVRRHMKGA